MMTQLEQELVQAILFIQDIVQSQPAEIKKSEIESQCQKVFARATDLYQAHLAETMHHY